MATRDPAKTLPNPGTLHHGMVRGIARAVSFQDDPDRGDFLAAGSAGLPGFHGGRGAPGAAADVAG